MARKSASRRVVALPVSDTITARSVIMPVMNVRVMRVRVGQFLVPVSVRMRFTGRVIWSAGVLVILVVRV